MQLGWRQLEKEVLEENNPFSIAIERYRKQNTTEVGNLLKSCFSFLSRERI